jgi:hypothetical protein
MSKVWDMIEVAPEWASQTARLASWGANYLGSSATNPWSVFVDMIGVSDDMWLGRLDRTTGRLSVMEINMLVGALVEYTDRPSDVTKWVTDLLDADFMEMER